MVKPVACPRCRKCPVAFLGRSRRRARSTPEPWSDNRSARRKGPSASGESGARSRTQPAVGIDDIAAAPCAVARYRLKAMLQARAGVRSIGFVGGIAPRLIPGPAGSCAGMLCLPFPTPNHPPGCSLSHALPSREDRRVGGVRRAAKRFFNGQQDVDRRVTPGRNPGGRVARQSSRGVRL